MLGGIGLIYLLGHGLTKGALFMLAGLLLATLGGIDEIGLRGLGRQVWPAGIAFAVGGLLLGGAPVGLMDEGTHLINAAASQAHRDWAALACLFASALTGGAVLRATGRIFLGWCPERRSASLAKRSRKMRTARCGCRSCLPWFCFVLPWPGAAQSNVMPGSRSWR